MGVINSPLFRTLNTLRWGTGIACATIGLAGIPEDLATWASWINSVRPYVSHDVVRTLLVAVGVGIIAFPHLVELVRLIPTRKSTYPPPKRSSSSVVFKSATKQTLPTQLRSQALQEPGFDDGVKRVRKKGFFNADHNRQGEGILHQYERLQRQGQKSILDHTTGLTWQQSGSPNSMVYMDAQKYIEALNSQQFGGCTDWRLPTLDEAMSLMEPDEKSGDLHIDSVFDETQTWIWTADQSSSGGIWKVDFFAGTCEIVPQGNHYYVRAVC